MGMIELIRKMVWPGIGTVAWLAGFTLLANAQSNPDALASANSSFAFDLFKQIAASRPAGNIFISPYSVSSAMQMVNAGAAGGTRQEIERALHLNGLAANGTAGKRLDESILSGQDDVILNLANSIWYKQGVELKPEFVADCTNDFRAETGALDFTSPLSAKTINDWAEKNTHGRITDIVQWPINPLTRVILANAIYFKGHWARQFDQRATKNRAFTLPDGTQKQVPMMQQHGHYDYCQVPGYQAVCLPYAGGRLQMCLFLPDSGSSPKEMLGGLDGNAWQNKVLPQFRDHEGMVVLPRFKLDYAVILNSPLEALGIKQAFSTGADFSAMSGEKLFLSEVKQKSYVAVNEEGTEAAAVTTGTFGALAVRRPEKPFEMILDHPFFFVIADRTTHSILFMGIVSDPGAASPP